MRTFVTVLFAVLTAALATAGDLYLSTYTEAVYSGLTGSSAALQARYGMRAAQHDYHLFLKSDWSDTNGTNLPFQYSIRGTSVGAGYRYWLPGNRAFVSATLGAVVDGRNDGKLDARLLAAGFWEWRDGAHITDLYGEVSFVDLADDSFFNARVREGYVIREVPGKSRLWWYGIGQLYSSVSGRNGTENRVEAGGGIGYLMGGRATVNLELRHGYSFSGTINDQSYWNPMVIAAGTF
jgi:hypothetical protein